MQITFTGHQLDVTDPLREFTKDKLARLERRFDKISSINVTFSMEKLEHIVEATVHVPGTSLHASADSTEDMYSAVDVLADKLERQIRRHKEKERDHH